MSTFGDRLRELRNEKGLTLDDLKDILDTTKATLSRYENDKRYPKIEFANRAASFFNVSVDYLLGTTDDRSIKEKAYQIDEKSNEVKKLFKNLESDLLKDGYKISDDDYSIMLRALKIALADNKDNQED